MKSRVTMRLAIFFAVIAVIFFCISRVQARLYSESGNEWIDGKVLLTGKDIETYSTCYYGDCYTDNGIIKGWTGPYKNKKKIFIDKEYQVQYQILKTGDCIFRFTDSSIAENEVHASKGRATLILSIVCACLAMFVWMKMR